MVSYQAIYSTVSTIIGVAGFIYACYEHSKAKRPDLRLKVKSILTHHELTVLNVGTVSTLISSTGGIILPNRRRIDIPENIDPQSYPVELGPSKQFVRRFSAGFVNRALLDGGYEGKCEIAYFVSDEAGRTYRSEKVSFLANDIKKSLAGPFG